MPKSSPKPKKRHAEGEFVWINFGEKAETHPARLVLPTSLNPPEKLADDDEVEIYYTTSMTYDWVEKGSIEYPQPEAEKVAGIGVSKGMTPSRRSNRTPKPKLHLKPAPVPKSDSSDRKSARQRTATTRKLSFDADQADENLQAAEQLLKKRRMENGKAAAAAAASSTQTRDDVTMETDNQDDDDDVTPPVAKKLKKTDDQEPYSIFGFVTAPLVNMYNGLFGSDSGSSK